MFRTIVSFVLIRLIGDLRSTLAEVPNPILICT